VHNVRCMWVHDVRVWVHDVRVWVHDVRVWVHDVRVWVHMQLVVDYDMSSRYSLVTSSGTVLYT